jgi:hypothetical protein
MAVHNRLGGNRLIARSAAPASGFGGRRSLPGRLGGRILGRPQVLPFLGIRTVLGVKVPLPVPLVRENLGLKPQVRLDEHLEVLASAEFQAAAACLYAVPHFVGEGNSLGACGLAHALLLQIIESLLTHFR